MSTLPNAHLASIDERKITAYLLSDSHPAGRAKAAFFRQHGFRVSAWTVLREALIAHAQAAEIISTRETEFGTKYIVDGALTAPDGQTPRLRAIWFAARGEKIVRLVTAYPAPGGER